MVIRRGRRGNAANAGRALVAAPARKRASPRTQEPLSHALQLVGGGRGLCRHTVIILKAEFSRQGRRRFGVSGVALLAHSRVQG